MSSTIVQEQPTIKPSQNNNTGTKRRASNFSTCAQKKFKHDRNNRKRSKSFSNNLGKVKSFKPVLPSKFLLGGNINDPLNLNSLQDEEINKAMNAVTPKSSPIPTPPRRRGQIEVIIPQNINDPLNLIDCADEAEYEQQMNSPIKKGRKKRVRKKRSYSCNLDSSDDANVTPEAKTPEVSKDSAKIPDESEAEKPKDLNLDVKKDKCKRKLDDGSNKKVKNLMDKIVSPVVPQPGAWLKRTNSRSGKGQHRPNRQQHKGEEYVPIFKEKNKTFQFGNYNRYYGYRNPHNEIDPRLKCFSHYRYLFEGKDILDIGCNIGHITLSVARDFGARSIVGLDIDQNLIGIARKNIKHYVISEPPKRDLTGGENDNNGKGYLKRRLKKNINSEFYPISMPILYGPIDIPGFNFDNEDSHQECGFPYNVRFIQGNYVLEDDTLLNNEQSQFDIILCLSTTKWIHLNWGDNGIKQAFRRMYMQLRPGGKLILEPQGWASYKNKKKLTETIYRNYNNIEFFPDKFTQYLLSAEVGFAKSEILAFPQHYSKGFQRPIQMFTKSTMFPSERSESAPSAGDSLRKVYLGIRTPGKESSERSSTVNTPDSHLKEEACFLKEEDGCVKEEDCLSTTNRNLNVFGKGDCGGVAKEVCSVTDKESCSTDTKEDCNTASKESCSIATKKGFTVATKVSCSNTSREDCSIDTKAGCNTKEDPSIAEKKGCSTSTQDGCSAAKNEASCSTITKEVCSTTENEIFPSATKDVCSFTTKKICNSTTKEICSVPAKDFISTAKELGSIKETTSDPTKLGDSLKDDCMGNVDVCMKEVFCDNFSDVAKNSLVGLKTLPKTRIDIAVSTKSECTDNT